MRIRGIAGAVPMLVAALLPSSAVAVEPGSTVEQRATRPAVWVVGDSVTVYAEDALRTRLEATVDGRIDIDAQIGRNVTLLDDLVQQQLGRTGRPRTMVLALGTNPDAEWTRRDYRRVLDGIPESVTVVLVTVFRSRGTTSGSVLQQMRDYSRAMRALAASRDNVCVAPWRHRVRTDPDRYLPDGVHPNGRGAGLFAAVVSDAVSRCTGHP